MEILTFSFGNKNEVVPKHWKSHIVEERSNVLSEADCTGLTHFEEWHYSVFDSSGICHLGMITKIEGHYNANHLQP